MFTLPLSGSHDAIFPLAGKVETPGKQTLWISYLPPIPINESGEEHVSSSFAKIPIRAAV